MSISRAEAIELIETAYANDDIRKRFIEPKWFAGLCAAPRDAALWGKRNPVIIITLILDAIHGHPSAAELGYK